MYVRLYIYIYTISKYTSNYIYIYIHVSINMQMYLCAYIYVYTYIHICMDTSVCTLFFYLNLCMYMYVYVHIHTNRLHPFNGSPRWALTLQSEHCGAICFSWRTPGMSAGKGDTSGSQCPLQGLLLQKYQSQCHSCFYTIQQYPSIAP